MSDLPERLNEHIDDLLAERRPRPLEGEEGLTLAQTAALLKAGREGADQPTAEFLERMRRTIASGEVPRPARDGSQRRRLIAAGLANLAAGVGVGLGLGRLVERQPATPPTPPTDVPLVGDRGQWFAVALASELSPGSVRAFEAGAVRGYLVQRGDQLMAFAAICTHMGCSVRWEPSENGFFCPCHGALYDADGRYWPRRRDYRYRLRPLDPLRVKVENGQVFVWSVPL